MIDSVLIANRGEIACRIIATCRRLGIRAIAVHSDIDAGARHVTLADTAIELGPAPAAQSYLDIDAILVAAVRTGARAIHPGYGFLAENAKFAKAVLDAGLVWIGPPPAAIEAMGDKARAKALMSESGVPVTPGYHGDDQKLATLSKAAERIGFPLLIKASAGGGGKGMRRVDALADLKGALELAKGEARDSFGDETILLEKLIERPRHIEIQVFADAHGNAVHLFERECSIQRRHQKVIEEAPAPHMTPELRAAMGEAAVAAAKAIDYRGAGTIEFLLEGDNFYFMEMNTRLQVEHPVTEMITGTDLVEWQLRVADGEPLPAAQSDLAINGHAFEVRLYAEDPPNDFAPSTGTLHRLRWPESADWLRVETGVCEGDEVSVHYDPLIAKLVVHGPDRTTALLRLRGALAATTALGPRTNLSFLRRMCLQPSFVEGTLDTGLIERVREWLIPPSDETPEDILELAALWLSLESRERTRTSAADTEDPNNPWALADGWRMNHAGIERWWIDGTEVAIERDEFICQVHLDDDVSVVDSASLDDGLLDTQLNGHRIRATAARRGSRLLLDTGVETWRIEIEDPLTSAEELEASAGGLTAPMPGKITRVEVKAGQTVESGQTLLVLEAMKMQHTIQAPADGAITEVFVAAGDLVEEGADLVSFEPGEEADS